MALTPSDLVRLLFPTGKGCLALTGGGGKTTFLGVLGHALASQGIATLLTTTTKIQNPFPVPVDWRVIEATMEGFLGAVRSRFRPGSLGLGVTGPYGTHKWEGVPPEWLDTLCGETETGVVLNEADGAFRLPIKAPADHEPVIPPSSTGVIPILGMSALGAPLDETHAFRPHLISLVTGVPIGTPVTEEAIVRLMIHPQGLTKGAPGHAVIVPFLNQAETPARQAAAHRIAREILNRSDQIKMVLVGRLKPTPRIEVLHRMSPSGPGEDA